MVTLTPEVVVGSRVEFADAGSGRRDTFTLVEPNDARPAEGLLSVQAPVARALLGHRVGEVVAVRTPSGNRRLQVLSVV